jgi:hypothetical protein
VLQKIVTEQSNRDLSLQPTFSKDIKLTQRCSQSLNFSERSDLHFLGGGLVESGCEPIAHTVSGGPVFVKYQLLYWQALQHADLAPNGAIIDLTTTHQAWDEGLFGAPKCC